jgi:hypothetical protein
MDKWLIAVFSAYLAWYFLIEERRRFNFLRVRRDHERLWLAAIPDADRVRVDGLLAAICGAFLIPEQFRFWLRPSDNIHELYNLNMRGQFADSIEYEFLDMSLRHDFGVDSIDMFDTRLCTVGMLVRCITDPIKSWPSVSAH